MKKKLKNFSILDKGFAVEGTVSATGQLIVKGTISGTLIGENVIIAEEGVVCARAEVASMTVGGTFEGEITASKELIILSSGQCKGKIVCRDFVVEAGGILNAQVSTATGQSVAEDAPVVSMEK